MNFQKPGCGDDNICSTDLNLQMAFPKYNYDSPNKLILGRRAGFSIDIEFGTTGEPAYNTKLILTYHQNVSYVQMIQLTNEVEIKCLRIRSAKMGRLECDTNPVQLGIEAGKKVKYVWQIWRLKVHWWKFYLGDNTFVIEWFAGINCIILWSQI